MLKTIKLVILMGLILLVSVLPVFSQSQEKPEFINENGEVIVYYFGTDSCIVCYETSKELKKQLEEINASTTKVTAVFNNITTEGNDKKLLDMSMLYNVPEKTLSLIPAVFIGDTYLYGKQDILENLEATIIETSKANPDTSSLNENTESFKGPTFGILALILGGFLDGINPCSISMMLFFISFAMMNKGKGNILLVGFFFALGTFVAYFGIGIGLLKALYIVEAVRILSVLFYVSLAGMSIYLICLNLNDYISIKSGKYAKIKNQLSSKGKKKIHDIIKSKLNSKTIYVAAFTSALIISFFEFFCTGQIYLPMITYLISLEAGEMKNYILLGIYNLAFIMPIVIITLSLSVGKKVVDVSQVLVDKLHLIKLVGAIFFGFVLLQAVLQLFKVI